MSEGPELPKNLDAERAILGALLVDNATATQIDGLTAADFFLQSHRLILGAIRSLLERELPADLLTVHEELERDGHAGAAGGASYLASLTDGIPSIANIAEYARRVREKAVRRRLAAHGQRIIESAGLEAAALPELLAQARDGIGRLEKDATAASSFRAFSEIPGVGQVERCNVWWVAPALYELGLLTVLDGPMLAMYCTFWSFWRQASDAVAKHGLTQTSKRGVVRPRPELKIMRECAGLLRALASDFGMTPAARARLHVQAPKPEEEADPWAEFASKPQ